jgi:hypothetical protein
MKTIGRDHALIAQTEPRSGDRPRLRPQALGPQPSAGRTNSSARLSATATGFGSKPSSSV